MFRLHPARQIVENWAVSSQLRARRNAMLASTALASRRAERLEVDAFLASLTRPRSDSHADAEPTQRHVGHRAAEA